MLQDFFRSGRLEMPIEPGQLSPAVLDWTDSPVNRIAVIVFVILVILDLGDMLRNMPQVWNCVTLWRANLGLEHSLSTARERNTTATVLFVGWILMADRYGIYPAEWLSPLVYGWSAVALCGVAVAYLIVRRICYLLMRPKKLGGEESRAAHNAMFTYFIPFGIMMMVTAGTMSACKIDEGLICMVIRYELAGAWLFSLLRTGQILSANGSVLATFLYLCGLELLPAGLLVASAALF